MTPDVKQALKWALNQDYRSVAAQYAKVLAEELEKMQEHQHNDSCASFWVDRHYPDYPDYCPFCGEEHPFGRRKV